VTGEVSTPPASRTHPLTRPAGPVSERGRRRYSFTCTTFAGGKPLKNVAEALA
jgi:hypothetical protein